MEFYRRHELPETVRRYKKDTDQFQQWLVKTAQARNIEVAEQLSGQVKNVKGRGKGKKDRKISVEQQTRLAGAIAETNDPLADISGLIHLNEAIRHRKEVALYHKLTNQKDEGHAHYNLSLSTIKTVLSKFLTPTSHKIQNVDEEASSFASNFIFIQFASEDGGENTDDDEDVDSDHQQFGNSGPTNKTNDSSDKFRSIPMKKVRSISLTQQERELQQHFLLLRFLYVANQIRQLVRNVWLLYSRGLVNVITAALVTDIAQSHLNQRVAGLMEDLDVEKGKLLSAIDALYLKIIARPIPEPRAAATKDPLENVSRDIFCVDAIRYIHNYVMTKEKCASGSGQVTQPPGVLKDFLDYFTTVRSQKTILPIWDQVTENMMRPASSSMDWLPFGLQIMVDIQTVLHKVNHTALEDITEHSLDIFSLIKMHIEYEDQMWAAGTKPDYGTKDVFKFSTQLIPLLDSMLTWVNKLLPSTHTAPIESKMTTDTFVSLHPTLAGLAMRKHSKQYRHAAIGRVQWFILFMCHIYNAARQVGGLTIAWPDLDFLIQTQGSQRIFIGSPPTHPYDFENHYLLAIGVAAEYVAADHRSSGKPFCARASREVQKKRGLKCSFPLEEKINAYYGPDPEQNRWLKRHNIFNYLYRQDTYIPDPEPPEGLGLDEELQDIFSSIAAHLGPLKSKKKRKNKSRVPTPDFYEMDEPHASLLWKMKTELRSHELHENFDYLSFYRYAYDLVWKVRNEVLFDNNMALERRKKINTDPNPFNHVLLVELFRLLKAQAQDPKIKTTSTELSTTVVALDQLKHIAKIMERFIRKNGAIELDRAKMRMNRDWDGLKAAYAAEGAARKEAVLRAGEVSDGDELSGSDEEVLVDGDESVDENSNGKEDVEQEIQATMLESALEDIEKWLEEDVEEDTNEENEEDAEENIEETKEDVDKSKTEEDDKWVKVRSSAEEAKMGYDNLDRDSGYEFKKDSGDESGDKSEYRCADESKGSSREESRRNSGKQSRDKSGAEPEPTIAKQLAHQAYVADEADELDEPTEFISSTTYLQDHDEIYIEEQSPAPRTKGRKRMSEAASPSFQFRTINGRSVQFDGDTHQVTKKPKIAKPGASVAQETVVGKKAKKRARERQASPKTTSAPVADASLPDSPKATTVAQPDVSLPASPKRTAPPVAGVSPPACSEIGTTPLADVASPISPKATSTPLADVYVPTSPKATIISPDMALPASPKVKVTPTVDVSLPESPMATTTPLADVFSPASAKATSTPPADVSPPASAKATITPPVDVSAPASPKANIKPAVNVPLPASPKPATAPLADVLRRMNLPSKSKCSTYPHGTFHRVTFPRKRHVVTLQRSPTTARLQLTRKRLPLKKSFSSKVQHAAPRHPRRLLISAKKRSIAIPCYASCCLARVLLNRETQLQCRIGKAGRARARVWESESDYSLD